MFLFIGVKKRILANIYRINITGCDFVGSLYLEYKIVKNRPGLLGDLASFFGLLNLNISKIASIDEKYRGLLIEIEEYEMKDTILESLNKVEELEINTLRKPQFKDLLALKHGTKITEGNKEGYYKFSRENLHFLIDFVSEYLRRNSDVVIGFKGSPRIGKTETAIATVVHANKKWQLLSSTLLRKVARTKIADEMLNKDTVFIIDAITTFHRSTAKHVRFIRNKILPASVPKIIEHPDVLVQETEYTLEDFDMVVEIIDEDAPNKNLDDYVQSFTSFDIG